MHGNLRMVYCKLSQLRTMKDKLSGRLYSQTVCTVAEVASGKGQAQNTLINSRDAAHDLGVKLSPCMCSHSSCPDRQQTVANPGGWSQLP